MLHTHTQVVAELVFDRSGEHVGVVGAAALELGDDAGKSARDVIFVRGEVHQEGLDLVDERVHHVEIAEGQGGVAHDEVHLVDEAKGGGEAGLQEV